MVELEVQNTVFNGKYVTSLFFSGLSKTLMIIIIIIGKTNQ